MKRNGFKLDNTTVGLLVLLVLMVLAVVGGVVLAGAALVQRHNDPAHSRQVSTTTLPSATAVVIVNQVTLQLPSATTTTRLLPTKTQAGISSTASLLPRTPLAAAISSPDTTVAAASRPSATFTLSPPTPLPPTATASQTHTPTPTYTPTATLTPSQTYTATTTATLTESPTATATPSNTPTSPFTPIPYPEGQRVQLYFDETSFYIHNPGNVELPTASIALRSVDAQGQPTGKAFAGELWARFYAGLEPGKCVAVEITQSAGWLRPSACQDYNAIITPQRTANTTFWLNEGDTVAFQVLWREEVVGACGLQRGICDIYLP